MFSILFTIFHVLICVLLVLAVLVQAGKGGGLASSFGGGLSSSSVMGGRTAATFLSKATSVLAAAFMLSCLAQSVAHQSVEVQPSTALEREMERSGTDPLPPPDASSLFEEQEPASPAPAEGTGAAEPVAEAEQ